MILMTTMMTPGSMMATANPLLTIDLLPELDGVKAFSTLRGCVNPDDPYDGFSVCDYTEGFDPERVAGCRRELAAFCCVEGEALVVPRQIHSADVAVVGPGGFAPGASCEVDAMVTSARGVALCVNTADCAPVVFADSGAGVIGICHSGWRGAVGNIAGATVAAMVSLGAHPGSIVASFGPMICASCFEVGPEVACRFPAEAVVEGGIRPHVDLRKAIALQLVDAGLLAANISSSAPCSRCNPSSFFSARRLGIRSGRTATVIFR